MNKEKIIQKCFATDCCKMTKKISRWLMITFTGRRHHSARMNPSVSSLFCHKLRPASLPKVLRRSSLIWRRYCWPSWVELCVVIYFRVMVQHWSSESLISNRITGVEKEIPDKNFSYSPPSFRMDQSGPRSSWHPWPACRLRPSRSPMSR